MNLARHLLSHLCLVAGALSLATTLPLEGQGEPTSRAWQDGDLHHMEVTLPGPLVDSLLLPATGEAAGDLLLLLIADKDAHKEGARRIFALRDKGGGQDAGQDEAAVQELLRGLPAEIDRLLFLGAQPPASSPLEGLLIGDGESFFHIVSSPGEPARLEPVLEPSSYQQGSAVSSMLPTRNPSQGGYRNDVSRNLVRIRPGRLEMFRVEEHALILDNALQIPVRARRDRKSLYLESPPVTQLRRGDGPALYAIGPEPHGDRRLRTILLDPAGEEPQESWALLPGPESVENSWYGWKDGKPILLVTTFSADKVGIFERHRLRVYPLGTDRTRAGRRPLLEATTASRRWQGVRPMIVDVDDDGRDDLVVFQTEGMGDGKLILEVFLGAPGNGFQLKSRRTVLDTRPDRWSYGDDLTGDGVPDLVTLENGQLEIFAGIGGSRRNLIERKASHSVAVEEVKEEEKMTIEIEVGTEGTKTQSHRSQGRDSFQVVDLNGDGRGEVLLLQEGNANPDRVRVVRFR